MIRYPAFDPPEYVNWQADPQAVAQFARTIEENAARRAIINRLTAAQLIAIYEGLLRNRLHDIALMAGHGRRGRDHRPRARARPRALQ